MSEERKRQVLNAIVKHFIQTAEPVGSQTILISYKFQVSPATIRNDMMALEAEGLIYQPHTSAGRVPTDKGYRLFVNELDDLIQKRVEAQQKLAIIQTEYQMEKIREQLFDAVSILSRASSLVGFATTPDNPRTFFLGMSNILRQPEFSQDSMHASEVMEMLEQNDNFISTLKALEIDDNVKAFIGEENILPQTQSCSIIVTQYKQSGFTGYLGILGPKRMDYSFNIGLVEEIKNLINK